MANIQNTPQAESRAPWTITDPGAGKAIPNNFTGTVPIVTAGAETNTLAAPVREGLELTLACKTYVGNRVVTVASIINVTGNNTITFTAAGQFITLRSIAKGAGYVWRVIAYDSLTLSTV